MRTRLDEQINLLNASLIEMGGMIEYAISGSARALTEHDLGLARVIMDYDRQVDQQERAIEQMCLRLLLQHQPVARDLRFISAALKMITDMERIGDQAADISELVTMLDDETFLKAPAHISEMARCAIEMVKAAINAFVAQDKDQARAVIDADDRVDGLFDLVKQDLIELIGRAPEKGSLALDLMMIAKYLERIGDHAVNIAEWVVFAVTGVHKGENGP